MRKSMMPQSCHHGNTGKATTQAQFQNFQGIRAVPLVSENPTLNLVPESLTLALLLTAPV